MSKKRKTDSMLGVSSELFQNGLAIAAAIRTLRASDIELDELGYWLGDERFLASQQSWAPQIRHQHEVLRQHGAALCAAVDWRTRIVLFEGYFATQSALRDFLPSHYAVLTAEKRRELFTGWVIWRAQEKRLEAAPTLLLLNCYDLLGPHAIDQLHRSLEERQHIGVLYGMLRMLQEAEEDCEPDAAAQLHQTIEELTRLSWRHLPPSLKEKSREEEAHARIVSAIGSILARFAPGTDHPYEAMARGLNGDLDIVPTAIANEVSRDLKDDGLYDELRVSLDAGAADKSDDNETPSVPHKTMAQEKPSDEPTPLDDRLIAESEKQLARVHAWIQADHKRMVAYRALVGEAQIDLAAETGLTDRTIRTYLRQLEEGLKNKFGPLHD